MRLLLTRALVATAVISLLASLWLLTETTQNSAEFDRAHAWLLLLNALGVVVFLVLIGYQLFKLIIQYRAHVPGTRLTGRMVGMFSVLAVVPLLVVFYFSLQFINKSIDSWFDVRVEQALDDALDLSRTALDLHMQELLGTTRRVASGISQTEYESLEARLLELRDQEGAAELTLFGSAERLVVSTAGEGTALVEAPTADVVLQVLQGRDFVGLDPIGESGLYVRAVVTVPGTAPDGEPLTLQALYPVRSRLNELADSVQSTYTRYRELLFLREPLKQTFTLTLSLVLLVSLLAALWGAFFSARRLVAPIQQLAAGTRAVAQGDFDTQLPLPAQDEVGFLVLSFNEMTRRLAEAQEQAQLSGQAVESERAYLEAVLARLSTGVLTVDAELRLRTANDAADQILGVDLSTYIGQTLADLATEEPMLAEFTDALQRRFDAGEEEWRDELIVRQQMSRRVLLCSCTALPALGEREVTRVVVFDDLTALIQAQRDAAWGEVARRLAHEIKNPLTPIQLSAERLRHRLLDHLEGKDQELLERATHTIRQQVEAMKEMVNAFGDYARAPDMELSPVDLNATVSEVADLYRSRRSGVTLRLDLDAALGTVEADAGRIRQILHNLVKNAVEALEGQETGEVTVTTRRCEREGIAYTEITVQDDGPGFEEALAGQVFDPYVTSKPKGTGLGLAIVKKLVEEHAGEIEAENNVGAGARVVIRLPEDETARNAMLLHGVAGIRRVSR